jgi:hypothetical protein
MTVTNARFDLLPIVVGVTGHRDVAEGAEPALRREFGGILERLAARCPSSPMLVLSALAAGADVIAAEEALARGIRVTACLPMPQEAYEEDFTDEEQRRFRSALARCWDRVVMDGGTDRAHGYAHAGSFIAYYSTVLVAFWDGRSGRGTGGTADIVRLRKSGSEAALDMLVPYLPDIGPIFQIVTPRQGEPVPHRAFTLIEHYPRRMELDRASVELGRQEFEQTLANVDRFNRDLKAESLPQTDDALDAFRARVGEAAQKLQRWTLISLQGLYVTAAIAGAGQLIIAPPLDFPAATPIRIALLALAFLWFKYAKREDYENRYQDYRAIAEALRIQHAWCSAGLRDRFAEASYLEMQQSEMHWIRLALRTIFLATRARVGTSEDSPQHRACKDWVDGQAVYYRTAGATQQRQERTANAVTAILAGVGVGITLVAVALWFFTPGVASLHTPLAKAWLLYFMTTPAAVFGWIATLVRFYAHQRGYVENARRYEHMLEVFVTAQRLLRNKRADAKEVLEKLGHEALSEHADWLMLHRTRPLDFVSA